MLHLDYIIGELGKRGDREPGRVGAAGKKQQRLPGSLILLLFLTVLPARAQGVAPYVRVGGSIGMVGEAYTASGTSGRRPPASVQLFANAGFNVLGFRSGINLLYASDETRVRQSMNRLGFAGTWRWLTVAAGDVTPAFSRYSLAGTTLRGGLVEIAPGKLRLALTGGQSRRPVPFSTETDFRGGSYRRMLYGARLGYGRERGTHVYLNTTYARDLITSIDDPSALEEAPAENWTVTPAFGIALFRNRLVLEGEVTASAFTPDLRNAAIDIDELPEWADALFTVRAGTRLDYAGEAALRLNLDLLGLQAVYSRVQPGFEALGLARLRSDQQTIRVQPQLRLWQRRLILGFNAAHTRNNLLDHLAATLTRVQWGTTAQVRLTNQFIISGNYLRLTNTNEPGPDGADPLLLRQQQVAQTVMLTPTLTVPRGSLTHTVSLAGTYQVTSDESPAVQQGLRESLRFMNASLLTTYLLQFASGFSLNASGSWMQSDARTTEMNIVGLNLGTGTTLLERKLSVNVTGGWSRSTALLAANGVQDATEATSRQLTGTLSASYRILPGDVVRLQLRTLSNGFSDSDGFSELHATLRYAHRF